MRLFLKRQCDRTLGAAHALLRGPGPPGAAKCPYAFRSKSIFYDAFVWARGALDSQKRWFPARQVPRVWEKFAEVIQAKGRANGAVMQSLGSWAKGKVGEAYKENQAGGAANWTPWGHTVANALVGKVRQTPSWRRRWSNFSLL